VTDRTKKVKEARDEAKKEIEAYRAQKEIEFRKFEAEVGFPSLPLGCTPVCPVPVADR
jgi:Vacuolar (H+)-ATPase G subunit